MIEDNADQADTSTQKQETHENFTEELESEAEEPSLQVGGQELVGATEEEDALYVASEFSPENLPVYFVQQMETGEEFGHFIETLDSIEGNMEGSHALLGLRDKLAEYR